MDIDKQLEIMQAVKDGERVEGRRKNPDSNITFLVDENHPFDFFRNIYRIVEPTGLERLEADYKVASGLPYLPEKSGWLDTIVVGVINGKYGQLVTSQDARDVDNSEEG